MNKNREIALRGIANRGIAHIHARRVSTVSIAVLTFYLFL